MIRELSDEESHDLLQSQVYGHLGCSLNGGLPYVMPLTYVYKDGAIYTFSFEGLKLECMRVHKNVCFQIEELLDDMRWRSIILWGQFEELTGADREQGMLFLLERFRAEHLKKREIFIPFRNSLKAMEAAMEEQNCVIFKISITDSSTRYEQYEQ